MLFLRPGGALCEAQLADQWGTWDDTGGTDGDLRRGPEDLEGSHTEQADRGRPRDRAPRGAAGRVGCFLTRSMMGHPPCCIWTALRRAFSRRSGSYHGQTPYRFALHSPQMCALTRSNLNALILGCPVADSLLTACTCLTLQTLHAGTVRHICGHRYRGRHGSHPVLCELCLGGHLAADLLNVQ